MYNELQCGSYAFMDADYGRILDRNGERIDKGEWENALFILTSGPAEIVPDAHIMTEEDWTIVLKVIYP